MATNKEPRPGYRFIRCPGQAHKPDGGNIDNCSICAPAWGTLEVLTRGRIGELAEGRGAKPHARNVRELARIVDHVLAILESDAEHNKDGDLDSEVRTEIVLTLEHYTPSEG